MANYKKIVDVDVLAEASESTNVLVEENGSLKKVPASAVGGSGGNDYVIEFEMDWRPIWTGESSSVSVSFPKEQFEDMKEKCQNGQYIKILARCKYAYGDGFGYEYYESVVMYPNFLIYPDTEEIGFDLYTSQSNRNVWVWFYKDSGEYFAEFGVDILS